METTLTNFFEKRQRDNGDTFWTLTDDRPDWLHDAVMAAHDGELPNDWRYETCRDICELIDADSASESYQVADSLGDVYTRDLLGWYADNVGRVAYPDDCDAEYGGQASATFGALLQRGQWYAIDRMAAVILEAVAEAAADDFADGDVSV